MCDGMSVAGIPALLAEAVEIGRLRVIDDLPASVVFHDDPDHVINAWSRGRHSARPSRGDGQGAYGDGGRC